jgi:hypothetical protein
MPHRPVRRVRPRSGAFAVVLVTVLSVAIAGVLAGAPADARERTQPRSGPSQHSGPVTASSKTPTAVGFGGAVTSVDANATRVGLAVLRRGGNAADAAVATAAALGVTEPYSSGIGGGGFFVYYNARTGRIGTIDGRETAPSAMPHDAFVNPATGKPYTFTPDLVTSGVSVGVPGTLATWKRALHRWGTWRLGSTLRPAARLARRGFVVDPTFRQQTLENKTRFQAFPATSRLFLRGGDAPAVGSVFRNRALARTYDLIAKKGTNVFYRGAIARQIARNVRHPRTAPTTTLPVPKGFMRARDLRRYRVINRAPTHVGYRGYDVYGMGPASSGGSTVGEALNILERFNVPAMNDVDALHHYLEASALAFADRGKYVGDPAYVHVPLAQLLSDQYAANRACLIDPTHAMTTRRPGHREPQHHEPHRGRPLGQRRRVHPHDRADRWLGHGPPAPWVPAQQRAHRLLRGLRPGRPQPDRPGQAAAVLDLADDRAARRQAVPRPRLAGRVDDHHHRPAAALRPDRPGDDHPAGDRGPAGVAAQHSQRHRRAGVHRPVGQRAVGVRSHLHGGRRPRHERGRDRCRDRDRVRAAPPADRRGRAGTPGRRVGRRAVDAAALSGSGAVRTTR